MAANDGTVIKAGWNNSYGNVVMIDHGGQIVTLYAHNSKLLVKTGDVVTRGQTIAYAGPPAIHWSSYSFRSACQRTISESRNWL